MKNAASVAANIDLLLRVSAEAEAAERRAAEVRQAAEDVAAHPILSHEPLTEAAVIEWLQLVFNRWSKGETVQAAQAAAMAPVEISGSFCIADLLKQVKAGTP